MLLGLSLTPARLAGLFRSAILLVLGLGSAHGAVSTLGLSYYRDFPVIASFQGTTEEIYASAIRAHFEGRPGLSAGEGLGNNRQFEVFLLDLPQDFDRRAHYSAGSLSDAAAQTGESWNPNGIFAAASLYQAFADGAGRGNHDGRLEGAALQLAIWDVLYGDGRRVDDPHSSFSVLGCPELIARANAMLASPANHPDFNLIGTFWDLLPDHGRNDCSQFSQDLLGPCRFAAVPEPGTYMIAGMAALYAVFLFLRRL